MKNQSHKIWLFPGSYDLSEKEVGVVLLKRKNITVLKIEIQLLSVHTHTSQADSRIVENLVSNDQCASGTIRIKSCRGVVVLFKTVF